MSTKNRFSSGQGLLYPTRHVGDSFVLISAAPSKCRRYKGDGKNPRNPRNQKPKTREENGKKREERVSILGILSIYVPRGFGISTLDMWGLCLCGYVGV